MSVDPANRPVAEVVPTPGRGVVDDIFLTYTDPVRVFFNLPRINRSTSVLVILFIAQSLLGWAMVRTGVYSYEVRRKAAREGAAYMQSHQTDEEQNNALAVADGMDKAAEFQAIAYQAVRIIGRPVVTLASVGLIGGILFLAVALSGGKPKMPLATGIVAFASLVQLPQDAVKLYLTGRTRHSRVEISAAAFPSSLGRPGDVSRGAYLLLRRLNPFDLWYWWLIHFGARKGARMSGRSATILVLLLALFDMGVESGLDYAELSVPPPQEK